LGQINSVAFSVSVNRKEQNLIFHG
jgi:hypothetical protein